MSGWGIGGWGYGTWGNGEQFIYVSLSGTAASGAVYSATPANSHATTGDLASANVGSVGIGKTVAISGLLASASVNAVSPVDAPAEVGDAAIGYVGNVTHGKVVSLSGVNGSGLVQAIPIVFGFILGFIYLSKNRPGGLVN